MLYFSFDSCSKLYIFFLQNCNKTSIVLSRESIPTVYCSVLSSLLSLLAYRFQLKNIYNLETFINVKKTFSIPVGWLVATFFGRVTRYSYYGGQS
jgi:hypothetical protein